MIATTPFVRAWRASIARLFAGAMMLLSAVSVMADDVLFPKPLHLTRRIEDPVSQTTSTVHEYYHANQAITVRGDKVTITDYARQELTEIDRAAGTYSVARFDELAAAMSAVAPRRNPTPAADRERWKVAASGRASDSFDVTFAVESSGIAKMDVGLSRNVTLSKAAFEVLIGASFPNPRSEVHEALLEVAGPGRDGGGRRVVANAQSSGDYALPVEQSITFRVANETLTIRSTVLDVRPEVAPPGTAIVPPGSRQVEAHSVRLARELREADQLPNAAQPQR